MYTNRTYFGLFGAIRTPLVGQRAAKALCSPEVASLGGSLDHLAETLPWAVQFWPVKGLMVHVRKYTYTERERERERDHIGNIN